MSDNNLEEIADLRSYIDGLPEELRLGPYGTVYRQRLERLEGVGATSQWLRERAVEVVTDAVVENCGVDGFAVLDSAFGNYPWPWLDVENSIVDMDIKQARDDEQGWQRHLEHHGYREVDRRVATTCIARARERVAALATTRPTCSRLVSVEHGQRPDGGHYIKYTMQVWRERARKVEAPHAHPDR